MLLWNTKIRSRGVIQEAKTQAFINISTQSSKIIISSLVMEIPRLFIIEIPYTFLDNALMCCPSIKRLSDDAGQVMSSVDEFPSLPPCDMWV
ncbi:hypothetical protein BDBG_03594 [Blastomyces gilchristii SLH14081]|uniref:Uncharacterized protein n=1 Tax=Blastomyces gilchristii (strain SLH14081) TaxID=559298 RepID=A0A179UIH0_BLAGS|nr:uncharacterized protein BDBG_03594 [Blastomyces gilchristii SLH14081]OAT07543.1 hypothetical protein BDBG_03594 [Blastomyces gilchristii SLH14081]